MDNSDSDIGQDSTNEDPDIKTDENEDINNDTEVLISTNPEGSPTSSTCRSKLFCVELAVFVKVFSAGLHSVIVTKMQWSLIGSFTVKFQCDSTTKCYSGGASAGKRKFECDQWRLLKLKGKLPTRLLITRAS